MKYSLPVLVFAVLCTGAFALFVSTDPANTLIYICYALMLAGVSIITVVTNVDANTFWAMWHYGFSRYFRVKWNVWRFNVRQQDLLLNLSANKRILVEMNQRRDRLAELGYILSKEAKSDG